MPSSVGIVFSNHPFNETKSRQPIQSAGGIQPDIVLTFLYAGIPVGWIMEYFQSPSLANGVFQHALAYASPPGDAGPFPRRSNFFMLRTRRIRFRSVEADSDKPMVAIRLYGIGPVVNESVAFKQGHALLVASVD